jgi:hypothetical protein
MLSTSTATTLTFRLLKAYIMVPHRGKCEQMARYDRTMSTRTYDSTDDNDDEEKCIVLELEEGDVVMYNPDNHRAWMQSDSVVDANSNA